MINLIHLTSMKQQQSLYLEKLFNAIEKYGGVVNRECLLDPDEAYSITYEHECPWVSRYYGSHLSKWSEVADEAKRIYETQSKEDMTKAMRSLADNFYRTARSTNSIVLHQLSKDITSCARLKHAIELALKHDEPVYNESNTDPVTLKHMLGYYDKLSPLSSYTYDKWYLNALGYGEHRPVTLTDDEVDLLGQCIAVGQIMFGLNKHVGELDPYTLEETQTRALETNPTSAYSCPTQQNARDKEARKEQLELAYEYKSDPKRIGNVPNNSNHRTQQGGNVLRDYIARVNPEYNPDNQYVQVNDFNDAMQLIAAERVWTIYYTSDRPEDDGYSKFESLPQSEEERELLVNNGLAPEYILNKYKGTNEWKVNYKVTEPTPWKLFSDTEDSEVLPMTFSDFLACKNRVVFAGPNPIAIVKQSFVHKWTDSVKEWAKDAGHLHMAVSWMAPKEIMQVLTNMAAACNDSLDSQGKQRVPTPLELKAARSLSGDDKSSFDNFQAYILWATFHTSMLSVPFKKEHMSLIKYFSVQTLMPMLLTPKGLMLFDEAMPSGDGTTNMQDGYISFVVGLFDMCKRSGFTAFEIEEMYRLGGYGAVFQGDDYESNDLEDAKPEDKQLNYSKLGLVMHPSKSLMSKKGMEYIRLLTNGDYRYYSDEGYNHLAMHAPLLHCLVKVYFGEDYDSKSPLIDEVSQINRTGNLQFHPRFIEIMKDMVDITRYHMGAYAFDYVPQYNMNAWRSAGSPALPNEFSVHITSPKMMNDIAAKEAEALGTTLAAITDLSWKNKYDEGKFKDLRVVKTIVAIGSNDEDQLNKLASMVKYVPM